MAAWLATYSEGAAQYSIEGEFIARDKAHMRANIASRFMEPDLYAELLSRHSDDNVVIDHERVRRNFPEGAGTIEMLCIYLIEHDLIQSHLQAVQPAADQAVIGYGHRASWPMWPGPPASSEPVRPGAALV